MEYIVCKKYNKKGIEKNFNLSVGTILNTFDNVIYLDKSPICYMTSQDAYDYFARNDDENGELRFELSHNILNKIVECVRKYESEIAEIEKTFTEETTDEEKLQAFGRVEDKSVLCYNIIRRVNNAFVNEFNTLKAPFYNAEIEQLESIYNAIKDF